MTLISHEDIDDLSLGSTFLATGGGGDPYAPALITREALKCHGPVRLIEPETLDDDALVVAIGSVGAPTVSLELLPSLDEPARALDAFENHVGRKVDALISFEIGGGNSLIPLVAASARDLPVVNADGMGRALPEAQMMTFPIAGVKPTPAIAFDYAGGVTCFDAPDTTVYERQIRALTMCMGGMITAVEHPMTGEQVKRAVIPGTVEFSRRIGKLLRTHRGAADDVFDELARILDDSVYGAFRQVWSGKVVDKNSRIDGGFDVGSATIEAFGGAGEALKIAIRNEYLVARSGERVLASVPDLIIIVDYETCEPINAERLRYGQRVAVFALGCPDFYRQDRALDVTGPRAFGFDFDFIPLENAG